MATFWNLNLYNPLQLYPVNMVTQTTYQSKWFEPRRISRLSCVIIQVRVILKKTSWLTNTIHLMTLKMTSTLVLETSVANNSSFHLQTSYVHLSLVNFVLIEVSNFKKLYLHLECLLKSFPSIALRISTVHNFTCD